MSNPHAFDELFGKIADLLDFVQKNQGKPVNKENLDDKVLEQVDALEKQIDLFKEITDIAVEQSGIDKKQLRSTVENPSDHLEKEEQKVLKRANLLKKDLQKVEREYARKCRLARVQKKASKTSGKKRKKKFKRLGGQGWMPL